VILRRSYGRYVAMMLPTITVEGYMEQALLHLVHFALWTFFIIFLLALIGLITIVRWVINLFNRTEAAVESGVQNVEGTFKK
jgi:hypothetical protein